MHKDKLYLNIVREIGMVFQSTSILLLAPGLDDRRSQPLLKFKGKEKL